MNYEIRETTTVPPEHRRWEIRDHHAYHVGTTWDQRFVDYLQDAEIVAQYIKDATRTESVRPIRKGGVFDGKKLQDSRILHAVLGMQDEIGELAKAVKSYHFYDTELDRDNLAEEAGDLLWYMALLLDVLGVRFADVMAANIRKLRARYPEKFTYENALNRDKEAEAKAMKGNKDVGINSQKG